MGDEQGKLEQVLAWMASVVAVGLLGAGVYAVFHSANGSGSVALLTIGSLALFVIAFRGRIRSMEFGGARVQLALKVRDSLKTAFRLRLKGNYEDAENEIEFAFSQFIRAPKVHRAYKNATLYRGKVLELLGGYVGRNFGGEVLETASTVSFLPLIDAVLKVEGERAIKMIESKEEIYNCAELRKRVDDDGFLRAAIIVRPGPDLNTGELVRRLDLEVRRGALDIDCFLLIQNCKESDSNSGEEFCELVNARNDLVRDRKMNAKRVAWELNSSPDGLTDGFISAVLTMCDRQQPRIQVPS